MPVSCTSALSGQWPARCEAASRQGHRPRHHCSVIIDNNSRHSTRARCNRRQPTDHVGTRQRCVSRRAASSDLSHECYPPEPQKQSFMRFSLRSWTTATLYCSAFLVAISGTYRICKMLQHDLLLVLNGVITSRPS